MFKRPEAHQESQADKFSCTAFHVNLLQGAREPVRKWQHSGYKGTYRRSGSTWHERLEKTSKPDVKWNNERLTGMFFQFVSFLLGEPSIRINNILDYCSHVLLVSSITICSETCSQSLCSQSLSLHVWFMATEPLNFMFTLVFCLFPTD